MQPENGERFYYPELDGLRFIAFLLVFIHHSPYYVYSAFWKKLHDYGWIGVDLFLCLSAFLITKLLIHEIQSKGRINFGYFYLRRILRIWPIYFLLISMVVISNFLGRDQSGISLLRFMGLMTFTENIVSAFIGYIPVPLLVTLWTISYEQQFYLISPWLTQRLVSASARKRLIILGSALLLGNIIRGIFIHYQAPHPAIWTLPITHFEVILFGIALALGIFDEVFQAVGTGMLILISGLCLVMVFLLPDFNTVGWKLMLTYPLSALCFTLIIQAAISEENAAARRILGNKGTVFMGKISYGLYVYHITSQHFANKLCNYFGLDSTNLILYPSVMVVSSLMVTTLISLCSYKFVEKPLLRIKEGFAIIPSRPT